MSNYTVQLQARRMQCPLSAQIGLMAITVENFLIGLINDKSVEKLNPAIIAFS